MKKSKVIFSIICALCLTFILCGCEETDINLDVKNVEQTDITVKFDNTAFGLSDETIENLKAAGFKVDQDSITTTVNNYNFKNQYNEKYTLAKDIINKTQPYLSSFLDSHQIAVDSSWYGYPVAGVTTLKLKSNFSDNAKVTINSPTKIMVNDGDELKNSVSFTTDKLKTEQLIKYNVLSIDSMKETIYQDPDGRKLKAEYLITAPTSISNLDSFTKDGYTAELAGNNTVKLTRTFENSDEFNNVFNLDNVNLFGIIGNVKISQSKSIIDKFEVSGKIAKIEGVKNYEICFRTLNNVSDGSNKNTYFTYKYNNKQMDINLSGSNLNMVTLLISLVCIISAAFVIIVFRALNKKIKLGV
jgi:hypothetical protein